MGESMILIIRDLVIAASLLIALGNGSKQLMEKILFEVKKAALTKVSRGLTPLSVLTNQLTGRKLNLGSKKRLVKKATAHHSH